VSAPTVRVAVASDASAIAELVTLLGYPTSEPEMEARLGRLLAMGDADVFVAEAGDGVAGVVALSVFHVLERDRASCRLTALAVRPESRRMGIGRALVAAVEDEARRRGCSRVEVTHRPERREAHALYAACGFHERPHRLVKPVE
jgi:predicted N-acetyltransferase YhbS